MIVIEASAMVDALVDEPANPELVALIADRELHAPSLIDYEVASALRGHAFGGTLTARQLEDAADDFGSLLISRYPLTRTMHHVLDLRGNFTVYDAAYVVLAQVLRAPLVTSDTKLEGARTVGVDVHVFRPSQ